MSGKKRLYETKHCLKLKALQAAQWQRICLLCRRQDTVLIPGSGRYSGEGNGNPLQFLACKIPWTEKPGRLPSMGLQRVGHD